MPLHIVALVKSGAHDMGLCKLELDPTALRFR